MRLEIVRYMVLTFLIKAYIMWTIVVAICVKKYGQPCEIIHVTENRTCETEVENIQTIYIISKSFKGPKSAINVCQLVDNLG